MLIILFPIFHTGPQIHRWKKFIESLYYFSTPLVVSVFGKKISHSIFGYSFWPHYYILYVLVYRSWVKFTILSFLWTPSSSSTSKWWRHIGMNPYNYRGNIMIIPVKHAILFARCVFFLRMQPKNYCILWQIDL